MKLFCFTFAILMTLVLVASAAHDFHQQQIDRQARILPGLVARKKLVTAKFKEIQPTALILLRSSNENETDLLPVYATADLPDDARFIPTPNGIYGHKNVQALAVPNKFFEGLAGKNLINLEDARIASLLRQFENNENSGNKLTLAELLRQEVEVLDFAEEEEDKDQLKLQAGNEKVFKKPVSSPELLSHERPQTNVEGIHIYLYATRENATAIKHQLKR